MKKNQEGWVEKLNVDNDPITAEQLLGDLERISEFMDQMIASKNSFEATRYYMVLGLKITTKEATKRLELYEDLTGKKLGRE